MAKGVCIILVVLNHLNDNIYGLPNFGALRMPLYFVLSGVFFKAYEVKTFFIKKINNILVPFVFWLIVSDIWRVWWAIRNNQYQYKSTFDFTIVQFVDNPLGNFIYSNGPLWFLICLFITNIIFYYIHLIFKDNLRRCFAIMFLTLIGFFLARMSITLPLWINTSLLALPYFYLGYCSRGMSWLKDEYSKMKSLLLGIGFIIISYVIYYTFDYPRIIMDESKICGSFIMVYLNGITFVIGALLLCKIIKWLPVVSYFGRYSIIVLCIHSPLLPYIPNFIEKHFGYTINVWQHTAITLMICWLAIPICKRFLPYFVAQKPLFKIPEDFRVA